MVIKEVNLETVCGVTSKLPENTLPEVAFARQLSQKDYIVKMKNLTMIVLITKNLL